jgi:hypothetical protein
MDPLGPKESTDWESRESSSTPPPPGDERPEGGIDAEREAKERVRSLTAAWGILHS